MATTTAPILYITGKGGVGKSFLARSLARTAAERGLRTALVEFAEAANSDASSTGADLHPGVCAVVVDRRQALEHLLTKLLRFRFLSERLLDSRTFWSVAAAAPGIKDLVYVSRLRDLAARDNGRCFDLVVVDGVASGHTLPLMAAPRLIRKLVPVGVAGRIARDADLLVRGGTSLRAVIVTVPEELAVAETLALCDDLEANGVSVAPPVINSLYPKLAEPEHSSWLAEHPEASPDACLYLARRHRQLQLVERIERRMGPAVTLPRVFASTAPQRSLARVLDTLLGSGSVTNRDTKRRP